MYEQKVNNAKKAKITTLFSLSMVTRRL